MTSGLYDAVFDAANGLEGGEVITAVNGQTITLSDPFNAVRTLAGGAQVGLTADRTGLFFASGDSYAALEDGKSVTERLTLMVQDPGGQTPTNIYDVTVNGVDDPASGGGSTALDVLRFAEGSTYSGSLLADFGGGPVVDPNNPITVTGVAVAGQA